MPSIAGSAESRGFLETSRKQPAQHTIDASCSAAASVINRTDASTYPARCFVWSRNGWGCNGWHRGSSASSPSYRQGGSETVIAVLRHALLVIGSGQRQG